MPVLKVNEEQFELPSGPTLLGGGSSADVQVAEASAGIQAVIDVSADGKAVIRRGSDEAGVRVNGVALGVEPTPLLHGDKVEIGGQELFFSDDAKSGATQFVSADDIAALAQKRGGPARATAATGGRLVSLVDGKEFMIPEKGITIGRDATADVVVAQKEVSRLHAEILPVEGGYRIHDRSTNGLYVNGTRVDGSQLLSRADVIRAGTEELRFYADAAAAAPGASAAPRAAGAAPQASAPAAHPAPALSAPQAKLSATTASPSTPKPPATPAVAASAAPAKPATPSPAETRPVMATVEIINEGPNKGTIFDIRTPLAHVGRGAHNDIVLNDDSVSDTHAKIQRRDDGWYVVDLGSTNGTYVGGVRFTGEKRVEGAPDVRFGGIKTILRAKDTGPVEAGGTRAIARVRAPDKPAARETAAQAIPQAAIEKKAKIPVWVWIVAVLVVGGAVAALMLKR